MTSTLGHVFIIYLFPYSAQLLDEGEPSRLPRERLVVLLQHSKLVSVLQRLHRGRNHQAASIIFFLKIIIIQIKYLNYTSQEMVFY